MKKITILLTLFLSFYSFGQVGTSFLSNSLYYRITSTSTVEIERNVGVIGTLVIPANVTYNSVNYQVTSIGNTAFMNVLA